MKHKRMQKTNEMMVDFLISSALAQNVILILMAIQKLFVTRFNKREFN